MARAKKPDPVDQARRLSAVRTMIDDMGGAMPTTARELRRAARETLDEIITELARPSLLELTVSRGRESHGA